MFAGPGEAEDNTILMETVQPSGLFSYPVDMSSFLNLSHDAFDAAEIPYYGDPAVYHPTLIARYALAHWNHYVANGVEYSHRIFLVLASWLVEQEVPIGSDAGGWPISLPHAEVHTEGSWLSAQAQGYSISVLMRAFQLTHTDVFLEVAGRAVTTFHRDILDGGVSMPIGEVGIFFEEVAVYPAGHRLIGFLSALIGLYEYVACTGDAQTVLLIERSMTTLHRLLNEFDAGFWTRSDLLQRRLASPTHLALQAAHLEALAIYSGCEHCKAVALRWKRYLDKPASRLLYRVSSRFDAYRSALLRRVRRNLFPHSQVSGRKKVCIPIVGFPVTGGTRAVLSGLAQVMIDRWQIEYLTQHIGPQVGNYVVHRFGTAKMHPWQFPSVWLYVLAGFHKLLSLLRGGANYQIILPQDGIFSAAFTVLAAKLAGVRVVCIDHGNLTLLKSQSFRKERIQALKTMHWSRSRRLLGYLLYLGYWPSLSLQACLSTRLVDHFLIPGVAGDSIEEACKRLGIQESRVTRFASMIETDRYPVLDDVSKANMREERGIPANSILLAMVCRLAPEKGIDIALEAIDRALSKLSVEIRVRVRIVLAGDGPLRKQIEDGIFRRELQEYFVFWGETSVKDVITLLSISDIFLYTSTRGACLSMAVLEAMAAGCAVIASTLPMANVHMLAEGRGITVPVGDAEETSVALVRLVNDLELCQRMGKLARDYVAVQHSPTMFRRVLTRVTYWSALDEFLKTDAEGLR